MAKVQRNTFDALGRRSTDLIRPSDYAKEVSEVAEQTATEKMSE